MSEQEQSFRFAPIVEANGFTKAPDQDRLDCLAYCIASQQGAGFMDFIDTRTAHCPECGAPGWNTGWGYFRHVCGAEIGGGEDGVFLEPCGATPTPESSHEQ